MVRDAEHREGMYKELPPAELMEKFANRNYRGSRSASFGFWNQYRRHGESFPEKSKELIFKRMDKWGLNTIANWSSAEVMNMNRKAFLMPLRNIGIERDLMGFCDVYAPSFESNVDKSLAKFVTGYKDNPWLIGYFIGNEPAWLNEEARLCSLVLEGKDRPVKEALKKHLQEKGDTPESRKEFVFSTFRTFLTTTNRILKKHDPHHLNLGIRFGNILELDEEILKICGESFDVLSFNCYDLVPDPAMMDCALKVAKLPGLIGTGYFQWCDQDLTGRNDRENYNCGLIDLTDCPYKEQVEAMMETAKGLYEIHSGTKQPFDRKPENASGHGAILDLWNE
ncbi:hypothetical protein [Bacteroides sp.]|uniref:hypothetical protein n=3 Tax=Bacteroides TaxID=816 RepID=UPI002580E94B|nr:hypothetical protein [Bacteroides sp.]